MTRTKVFVGNLSFKTKREELAAEFQAAGRVVEANIITRGTRSLGYGFVEMESEEDAQKAINIMNKKSIDNREINVELAKPRDETKIGERRPAPQRRNRRPPNSSGGNGGNSNNNNNQGGGSANNNASNNNPNTSGNKRQKGSNKPNAGSSSSSSETTKEGGSSNNAASPSTPPKEGGDKSRRFNRGGPRRFRRRYPRKDLPPRKESETSLFIANLPFSIDSQALNDMYKAHNVKSAHVVANRNGKSKGFGFVELATQADQKAALDATNKLNVQGRELIVKIALTPVEAPKDAQSDNQATKDEQKN